MSQGSETNWYDVTTQLVDSLEALQNRPQIISGFFRDYLSRHFQEGFHEHPELQELIWSGTPRTSILIEMLHKWQPQTSGRRPAVIIKRNAYQNFRQGIDDRNQPSPVTGEEHFTTFWSGSHTLFCLGATGGQAEVLATEVQRELTQFGPELRKALYLMRFRVLGIGEVSLLEEAADTFVVPVTVAYIYTESWKVGTQSPRLSKLSLSLSNFLDL